MDFLYILEFCIYYVHIKSHHFKFQIQILPVDNKSHKTDTKTKTIEFKKKKKIILLYIYCLALYKTKAFKDRTKALKAKLYLMDQQGLDSFEVPENVHWCPGPGRCGSTSGSVSVSGPPTAGRWIPAPPAPLPGPLNLQQSSQSGREFPLQTASIGQIVVAWSRTHAA